MDMVCKIGHKSLFLKLSTNFVSVQDNPSETSVSSFQMSTYILNCMFQYQYVCKNMKETIQKLVFIGPESDHWLCLSLTYSLTN